MLDLFFKISSKFRQSKFGFIISNLAISSTHAPTMVGTFQLITRGADVNAAKSAPNI